MAKNNNSSGKKAPNSSVQPGSAPLSTDTTSPRAGSDKSNKSNNKS